MSGASTPVAKGDPLEGNDRYRYRKTLEWGGRCSVLLAEDRTQPGLTVAVILVECGEAVPPRLEKAIKHHGSLRHPHVLAFHHVFAIPGFVAIAVEFPEEGSLLQYVERLSREQVAPVQETLSRWLFQQVVLAVQYCHRKGVACGDIRLETVLLQRGALLPLVKLCGFGYSRADALAQGPGAPDRVQDAVPDYTPPELWADDHKADTSKGDIWSLGVVLYAMMTGHLPFSAVPLVGSMAKPSREVVLDRMLKSQYEFPPCVPESCRYLMSCCLEPDPSKRMGIGDVMRDAWFLKDFPKQAHNMNDYILAAETGQPIQIRSTPHVARKDGSTGAKAGRNQWDNKIEDWLDEAMEEEDGQSQRC